MHPDPPSGTRLRRLHHFWFTCVPKRKNNAAPQIMSGVLLPSNITAFAKTFDALRNLNSKMAIFTDYFYEVFRCPLAKVRRVFSSVARFCFSLAVPQRKVRRYGFRRQPVEMEEGKAFMLILSRAMFIPFIRELSLWLKINAVKRIGVAGM